MALDEWLLDQAVLANGGAGAVLRFYHWQRPTLSIGYHQRRLPEGWREVMKREGLDIVRRPSGGRAVLHAGELTYALVWPQAPERRTEAYRQACRWLQSAFAELGHPLLFGAQAAAGESSSCFASSTAADLVHADGAKRIGSAQLWRSGCLLQHGSILLQPPESLWRALFGDAPPPLPPLPLAGAGLLSHLRRCAERELPPLGAAPLQEQALQPHEWGAIAPYLDRYHVPADGWRQKQTPRLGPR
jgi:lipoate-protein ligase A